MTDPQHLFDNSQTIQLSDDRLLGYRVCGDLSGRPFFSFHGLPGSRMEGLLLDDAAKKAGVKIITPDRPGYGLSTFDAQRTLLDWGRDVAQLADKLEIDKFGVIGISGGAPCALSCAYTLPQRVSIIGIVCGLGPVNQPGLLKDMRYTIRLGFSMARYTPGLLGAVYGIPVYCAAKISPALTLQAIALQNGGADRKILSEPVIRKKMMPIVKEAFRQGINGAVWDMVLYANDWGFPLEAVSHKVMLWHGDKDKVVPLSHSRYFHAHLSGASLQVIPGEAHFSLPIVHGETILRQLLACS